MFESTTDRRIRNAYHAAHEARGEAMREFWKWLTKGSSAG